MDTPEYAGGAFGRTPGILWPKFEDQMVGLRLAFIGSIKDEILNTEELAAELIKFLNQDHPGVLEKKYHIESNTDAYVILERIAESRHCLLKGNDLDTEKSAALMLDDFQEWQTGKTDAGIPTGYMI